MLVNRILGSLACLVFVLPACAADTTDCPAARGVSLQVLGSGGPIADDGRASSAYLVWVDGRSRLLIDAGGGAFLRFGEAEARFTDLEFIGLSHFHTDHSADFPALLKSGVFSGRKGELRVAGPGQGGPFPGLRSYIANLIGPGGAYGYLSDYIDDGDTTLSLAEVSGNDAVVVYDTSELRVTAMQVPHGIVPALAFRIDAGDQSIVFSSDQNGSDPGFVDLARNADILVMHLVIPENAGRAARSLHAQPSMVGDIAAKANPGQLLLSHFMARSLRNLDENLRFLSEQFDGSVLLAEDLMCINLQQD